MKVIDRDVEKCSKVKKGINNDFVSVKENEVLNIFDKEVVLLQSLKGVLGIQCLYDRTVDKNFDIMTFTSSKKDMVEKDILWSCH